MSAYSTLNITRSRALAIWAERNGDPSDAELEELMDEVLEPQLYNAIIVDDEDSNDDSLIRNI